MIGGGESRGWESEGDEWADRCPGEFLYAHACAASGEQEVERVRGRQREKGVASWG